MDTVKYTLDVDECYQEARRCWCGLAGLLAEVTDSQFTGWVEEQGERNLN